MARPIMVMGCTSDAGKSLLTTALCRHFADRGLRVAPFKAQNMSTNAAVTADGLEIGRAQYVQALAARTKPESTPSSWSSSAGDCGSPARHSTRSSTRKCISRRTVFPSTLRNSGFRTARSRRPESFGNPFPGSGVADTAVTGPHSL